MNERLKNILLVVLTVTMIGLFAVNLIIAPDGGRFTMMRASLGIGLGSDPVSEKGDGAVLLPQKLGVMGERGLYMTSGRETSELFAEISPLLAEAFGSVGDIEPIDRADFIDMLGLQGIYMAFSFPVSFYNLQYFMTGETGLSSEQAASAVLLTVGEDGGRLAFYDGSAQKWYAADMAAGQDRLANLCEGYETSNAFFASGADGYHMLAPWEPVWAEAPSYPTYSASSPDFTAEGVISRELLGAFSVNPFLARVYKTTGGDIVYVEGYTSLQFSKNGYAAYSSTGEQGIGLELPSGLSQKELPAAMARSVSRILSDIYSAASCRCSLSLADISAASGGGYVISFERMEGGAFITESDGYTAVVTVRDGSIVEMRLHIRNYTEGQPRSLLPYNLAASLVRTGNSSLSVRCVESGEGALLPELYITEGGEAYGVE